MDEIHLPDDRCPKLGTWIRNLPKNVQVVLTSRPYIKTGQVDLTLRLAHPTSDEALLLTMQRVEPSIDALEPGVDEKREELNRIRKWIKKNKGILPLLINHRALNAFNQYIQSGTHNRTEEAPTDIRGQEKLHYRSPTPENIRALMRFFRSG